MAQLLVRNVPDVVVSALKARATSHGRSLEAEHRALLEETLEAERRARVDLWRTESRRLRDQLKDRPMTSSVELIRESRDER